MAQRIEVEPGLYYNCSIEDSGHFSLSEYTVRLRRKPARAELHFTCIACGEPHFMVLEGRTHP